MSALCAALAAVGCVSKGTDIPPVTAGTGVTIDPKTQTVSIDQSKVPTLPTCAPKQVVTMSADGTWSCASAAADSQKLNGLTADNYAAAVNGISNDSAKLNGLTPDKYAAATSGVANNSGALGGLPPANYQQRNPTTGDLSVTGRALISHSFDYSCRIILGAVPNANIINPLNCTETIVESLEGTYCGEAPAQGGASFSANDPVSGAATTGYRAAKILCEAVAGCGAGAHLCSGSELVRSYAMNIATGNGWYASGTLQDCNGFTDNTTTAPNGTVWLGTGRGAAQGCVIPSTLKCCR